MNLDIKAQWVAALRSGQYPHGMLALKSPEGEYCPLGVLCDLAVKAGVAVQTKEVVQTAWGPADEAFGFKYRPADDPEEGLGCAATLPRVVIDWAGLDDEDPKLYTDDGPSIRITELNDDCELSFSRLADLIEEQL